MSFEFASRLRALPPYLFAEMEEQAAKKRAQGVDLIDFGIGDPDIPTPKKIVDIVKEEVAKPENHTYPSSQGERYTRVAIAEWYSKRFGVDVNPDTQVCVLLGSKEGLANICRAFVNAGEKVIVPDPAYPVYTQGGALLTDALPIKTPLRQENDFLMNLSELPRNAKMLYMNYPNNPTGAIATDSLLREALEWCDETQTIMCYDNAYSEITFDGYTAPSILEFGDNAIEFGSVSKTFNMTGYRLGYAVGSPDLVAGLKKVKSQIDSGAPKFIQKAAVKALAEYQGREVPPMVQRNCDIYMERRDVMVKGLRELGFETPDPKATFYLWLNVGGSSMEFTKKMLDVGVIVTPGIGFGAHGEGFVRLALTRSVERVKEALERMEKVL
ncbi:MAG TPA: aminotransferase class I/II-fold pyridoxal phosphate-dependent enzyme [Methanomassiliicoccales archaeon]|nr:aminotransferase class I/II-fold pyridoxal phosphate-dependent enzyme [Methanomassiliicoccales archaeon]